MNRVFPIVAAVLSAMGGSRARPISMLPKHPVGKQSTNRKQALLDKSLKRKARHEK